MPLKNKFKITPGGTGYLLILPLFLWLIIVIGFPIFYGIYLSFFDVPYGIIKRFVFIENYNTILNDSKFRIAFVNSLIWTFGNMALQTAIGLGAALLLNRPFKGRDSARIAILIPFIIPAFVTALVWRWMMEPDLGIFNAVLKQLNLIKTPIVPLVDYAMLTVIIENTWRFSPFAIIFILSALQTVPNDVIDAAKVDGAGHFQIFRHVTLPIISPFLSFIGLLAFFWNFNLFDLIWLTTGGGPGDATETLPILIYRRSFREFNMGEGATISVFSFIFMAIITAIFYFLPKLRIRGEKK
ncbi:MAG: sugar ABC transporter permease [Nitrososphaerota archaeon]